jgi:uncharacterized membrane protein YgcG
MGVNQTTMKPKAARSGSIIQSSHAMMAITCVALLSSGNAPLLAQTPPATQPAVQSAVQEITTPAPEEPKIPNDQLDSLVAPIALFPDPLLAQTLAASTYPLEVIQLKQWMDRNKQLKGKALTDAVAKQQWDPSIQSMAMVPDMVGRLASNIQWTTDLGNAFLAQQQDVMDAVQRMRAKAQTKGALKTSKEQVVQSKSEGGKEVIIIEQANPETVYVPSYDPAVVYGPPVYPYYPYSYPGYYPGMGLAFGTGILIGAGIANNWWGNCNWGGGDININNNNNFNRNSNFNRNQINNRPAGGNKWQHNANHRGPAPYSNRKTSEKFGGNDRGGPNSNRSGGDRNRPSQQPSNRPGGDRSQANRPGGDRSSANRPTNRPSTTNRPSSNRPSTTNRPSTSRPSGGDRVSNTRSSHSPSPRSNSAFSSGGGFNRSSASSSFSRGSSSFGGSRGGGMSRGGGSRGGGRRR